MKATNRHLAGNVKPVFTAVISFTALAVVLTLSPMIDNALTPVTVAWDANDPAPDGYILHWGTASGTYTASHDAGPATQHTIADLQEGVTYYFAATAYAYDNDVRNQSTYSEEISYTVGFNTHTILASADANGSITPAGAVVVADGDSQTFHISPAPDYQILAVRVNGNLIGTASSYTFDNVTGDHTITASFVYVDPKPLDTDADGVPDAQDAFPQNPLETTDTDGDGTGNNADTDDDGDRMPDAWEIENDLNPLVNDAGIDADGDGATNFEEYEAGTGPHFYEDQFPPEAPALLRPADNALVSLTPELMTDEFYDSDPEDVHAQSRWQIFRADDNFCVLDVTSHSAHTTLKVPKLILEEDTDYIWQVQHINSREGQSEWSQAGTFRTDFIDYDPNGNGIPDDQEVLVDQDLDENGVIDSEQSDIKCVHSAAEDVQIGVSVKDSENAATIVSMEIEDALEALMTANSMATPKSIEFGLIDFKILVDAPGDETVVTIHLSRAARERGKLYKYDPINAEWLDYSDYAQFSPNRRVIYLTLKDGGFGDADGIENGIIVDPLTVGTDSDMNEGSGSSDSKIEDFMDRILPNVGCFISTAVYRPEGGLNIWSEIRGRELAILFILILLAYIRKSVRGRKKRYNLSVPI